MYAKLAREVAEKANKNKEALQYGVISTYVDQAAKQGENYTSISW